MTSLVKMNLGTPPTAVDGDTNRDANAKSNSNVDVLNAQATLTSAAAVITAAQALTVGAHIGKRVNISLPSAGVINLPAAATCAADQVTLLRNVGTTVVTLAIATGSGDTVALSKLNPGETALMDVDGVHTWSVLMRGRTNSDNETVNGNCTVNGNETVGGTLNVTGKISGANSPNLQLNGTGELGSVGWSLTSAFSALVDSVGGFGTYIGNPLALSAASAAQQLAPVISVGPSVALTIGVDIANQITSGSMRLQLTAWNGSGTYISDFVSQVIPNGTTNTRYVFTGTTPAGTATVRANLYFASAVTAPAFGITLRNLKVETGTVASLYSQETSVAYLQGAPALSGRPTFAGKTPWDSGNFTPANYLQNKASVIVGNSTPVLANLTTAPAIAIYATFVAPAAGGAGLVSVRGSINFNTSGAGAPVGGDTVTAQLVLFDETAGGVAAYSNTANLTTRTFGTGAAYCYGNLNVFVDAQITPGHTYTVRLQSFRSGGTDGIYPANPSITGVVL